MDLKFCVGIGVFLIIMAPDGLLGEISDAHCALLLLFVRLVAFGGRKCGGVVAAVEIAAN